MSMFENRHVKTAMIVAPLLGVATYLAVDQRLSEKPRAAVPGHSYPLAEAPSCRYESGICRLKNGDIELRVFAKRLGPSQVELELVSDLPVEHALVSVGRGDGFAPPLSLEGQAHRRARIELEDPEQDRLRWAFTIARVNYYAETSALFVDRKTVVSQ